MLVALLLRRFDLIFSSVFFFVSILAFFCCFHRLRLPLLAAPFGFASAFVHFVLGGRD